MTAIVGALCAHSVVMVVRICDREPLAVHERVKGTPTPAHVHMALIETSDEGAAIAAWTAYAPSAAAHDDHARMSPPQKPRMGLWLLDVPLSEAPLTSANTRDAGPD